MKVNSTRTAPPITAFAAPQARTMQAIVQDKYGSFSALELRHIDKPAIGDDDVFIRVQAASVHIGDWYCMTGLPYILRVVGLGFRKPKAYVRGMDVAGTVEAVGKNVTQFQTGDAVFGTCDGAFAEYACSRADTLAFKPANLTFEQAAAVPTSALAALQALRDVGGIQIGQKVLGLPSGRQPAPRVLIVGASGGVGMFAVQIAKSFGAEVTGVCSTAKVSMVRSLGADHVVDYTQSDFTRSGQREGLSRIACNH